MYAMHLYPGKSGETPSPARPRPNYTPNFIEISPQTESGSE